MNVYSSDQVLAALAQTYFPDRNTRVAIFSVADTNFRLLDVDGRAHTSAPYVDFWEPCTEANSATVAVSYVPRVSIRSVDAWDDRPPVPERGGLAPYVDWARVPTEADLHALIGSRNRGHLADSRRQRRRIEREVGQLTYQYDDPDPSMLDQCVSWKAIQRPRTGHLRDDSEPTKFLHALRGCGILKVSTLRAGTEVLAIHLGLAHARRFYSLVPAYDSAFNRYSPGRLLLEDLLRTSADQGDEQFEFLIGSENYKWLYATDARIVGSIGRTPLSAVAQHELRRVKRLVRKRLGPRRR